MLSSFLRATAALLAGAVLSGFGVADALSQTSVKIGYAVSRTGPNAGGAAVSTMPPAD